MLRLSPVSQFIHIIHATISDHKTESGGTCVCSNTTDVTCTYDTNYLRCVQEVNQDLVTGTAAISALSSVAMGMFANIPVSLALISPTKDM